MKQLNWILKPPQISLLFRIFELILSSITNEKPETLALLLENIVTSLIKSKLKVLRFLARDAEEEDMKELLFTFFGLSYDTWKELTCKLFKILLSSFIK